jgi:hypothetical protein
MWSRGRDASGIGRNDAAVALTAIALIRQRAGRFACVPRSHNAFAAKQTRLPQKMTRQSTVLLDSGTFSG